MSTVPGLHILYGPPRRDHIAANLGALARRIVRIGIEQFPQRRAANVFVPRQVMEAEIGFSVESITESFDGLPNLLAAQVSALAASALDVAV